MPELLGKIPTKDPKPSVTGTLRKIHFYIECEEAIEECRLAIIPRCQPAIGEILAAILQQSEIAGSGTAQACGLAFYLTPDRRTRRRSRLAARASVLFCLHRRHAGHDRDAPVRRPG